MEKIEMRNARTFGKRSQAFVVPTCDTIFTREEGSSQPWTARRIGTGLERVRLSAASQLAALRLTLNISVPPMLPTFPDVWRVENIKDASFGIEYTAYRTAFPPGSGSIADVHVVRAEAIVSDREYEIIATASLCEGQQWAHGAAIEARRLVISFDAAMAIIGEGWQGKTDKLLALGWVREVQL